MLRTIRAIAGIAMALSVVGHAQADTYPSKPIQMIVPQAPGGTNDIVARLVAADLSQRLGQQVVVENRPGAGGNIGTQTAARSAPDGYTLLMTISSTQAINPSLYRSIPFDPIKDFEPIAPVATVPNVLVVNPAFPAKSMSELIAMAKAKPDYYRFASAGNGTLNHLLGEMLNSMAAIKLEHVPYKGVAPALNDVLGNQVPMAFASLPSVLAHIKAGKVRALGVSSAKRSPFAPDIPAISETVPGYSGDLWVGLFAVRGTPKDVTQKLAATMQTALADKTLRDKLAAQGAEVLTGTPQQFSTMLRGDIDKWAKIVKQSGAQVD
ncbi:tripartite tricarboxylate transporter substrate binding protein [Cupriavidus metallidurans]|jgi:tripartite-type tricarboxylate transporter receptor subunit TctC|uniref:Tripartite tricarboxylate transporter substrate binding protein n=1 Tax=Cupriavidus metallidurans TaxID=119219 RepID=A0A482IYT7_9BURK|nr:MULTISPECIES: tripartite tricarboxylate transporter substrate binding protein [Cupriavidus]HBO81279.1 tripartite tricarboxylate transporter substrate binding protein [Cupriavidus sp.]KWR86993.1 LacI family transcriptional regulator [Cupriavidus sp. SHE]QBP11860.1 tripartite tricarboxylate transporter substrate binding protein [Cupriavidus metallidurans]QWC91828.1 tripartite tricarboxylate transporter substrate binding protein [Cupriavidus metallidurans]GMG93054.1 MFS transporter [Cupriavidu